MCAYCISGKFYTISGKTVTLACISPKIAKIAFKGVPSGNYTNHPETSTPSMENGGAPSKKKRDRSKSESQDDHIVVMLVDTREPGEPLVNHACFNITNDSSHGLKFRKVFAGVKTYNAIWIFGSKV